jgi:hypothetical protein
MPVQRVLAQGDERTDAIAVVERFAGGYAQPQPGALQVAHAASVGHACVEDVMCGPLPPS